MSTKTAEPISISALRAHVVRDLGDDTDGPRLRHFNGVWYARGADGWLEPVRNSEVADMLREYARAHGRELEPKTLSVNMAGVAEDLTIEHGDLWRWACDAQRCGAAKVGAPPLRMRPIPETTLEVLGR